jgi:hypothetical protein
MTVSPIAGGIATETAMKAATTERISSMISASHYSIWLTTSMVVDEA